MTRVLIVDDDPLVCAAIEIYLERHGFDVTIADGGEAGLRALEDTCFDLMLVDIFMPHMRGFELIRIFHERAPTVPLVAMSGYAFANLDSPAPDFLRMALELGAARCLRKPFTPGALLAVVNECLAEARSRLAASSSRTSGSQIFRRAGDRSFRDPMHPSQPSASLPSGCGRIRIDKILFTINDIDEGFLAVPICTDERVNLRVATGGPV